MAANAWRRHRLDVKIGPYEVLGELGRGGMGAVYRVRAPDGREVALKVLLKADQRTLAQFERERRLLTSLGEKEGFVGLLDAGKSEQGAWLVMPFVPGGTLRHRLERGPLGVEETVALGVELATALGRAHERGIVHRDVKPENVLFTAKGRPLLADLGLAKHFDRGAPGASQSVSLTQDGAFKGTAAYMAPEQTVDAARAGPPADVFALGAVLYECLSGRPAFEGDSLVSVVARLTSGAWTPIGRPDMPAWLEAIVKRALAPRPESRFAGGTALAQALDRRAAGERRGALAPLVIGAGAGAALLVTAAIALGRTPAAKPLERPSPPLRPPPSPAEELAARGEEKYGKGDIDGAIADLDAAVALDPKLPRAWATRGAASEKKDQQDRAIQELTRAVELDPGLAVAWADRGIVHGEKGEWDAVVTDETRALELDPGIARAWQERGVAKGKLGDRKGEIEDETKAIALDPKLARAWLDRGMARGLDGDGDGALSDTTQAIELDPALAGAWSTRGITRFRRGDREGGITDLERALALDPKGPNADAVRAILERARGMGR